MASGVYLGSSRGPISIRTNLTDQLTTLIQRQEYCEAIRFLLDHLPKLQVSEDAEQIYVALPQVFPHFNREDLTQLRQRLPQLLRFGTEDQRNQVQFQLHFWDFQETNRVLALNQLKTWLDVASQLPHLERMYSYLFQWIPEMDDTYYRALVPAMQTLLDVSPMMIQQQLRLCLELAQWNLKRGENETHSHRFRYAFEATQYLARAIQIAETRGLDASEVYKMASALLGREGTSRGKFAKFNETVEDLKRQANLAKIKALLEEAGLQEKFLSHRPFFRHIQGLIATTPAAHSVWYDPALSHQVNLTLARLDPIHTAVHGYLEKFKAIKICYQEFHATHPKIPAPQEIGKEIRSFQEEIFSRYQELIQLFVKDILLLLGHSPCDFEIHAMGSLGRKEPCSRSDFEVMILYEDPQHRPYFEHMAVLLRLQVCLLGETARDDQEKRLVFTSIHQKNPQGFMIEGNPEEFLLTPQELLALQKQKQSDPSTFTHMSYKTTPFYKHNLAKDLTNLFQSDLEFQKVRIQNGLNYLKERLKEFQRTWRLPLMPVELNLKKQFAAPLSYFLADLSLLWSGSPVNTLALVDFLTDKKVFNESSATLLKEAVASIYFMRSRLHNHPCEAIEECRAWPEADPSGNKPALSNDERVRLENYFGLILIPLYTTLSHLINAQDKNLESIYQEYDFSWIGNVLDGTLFPAQDLVPYVKHFVTYLVMIKAPIVSHVKNFKRLSDGDFEPLRQAYLEALKLSQQDEIVKLLSDIPNRGGFRYSSFSNPVKLYSHLKNLTLDDPPTHAVQVKIEGAFPRCRYLKPELIASLLDEKGDIRRSYKGSAHNVTGLGGLHFKQKPTHPLMEFAIHNLFYRLGGFLTPPSMLARFEVTVKGQTKAYPVLISETIPGKTLKEFETLKQPLPMTPAAWAQWTWLTLGSLLTRPGDGLPFNYLMNEQGQVFCIDNDISFVEPVVQEGVLKRSVIYFCSALFCLFHDKPLDLQVLKAFCSLDPDLILHAWMEDVIDQEKVYLSLFTPEEQERLYNEDPKNQFKATILFKEGTLATLNLQFCRLQNYLLSAIGQNKPVTSLDLLKQLLSLKDSPTLENSAGTRVAEKYQRAIKAQSSVEKQLQSVTSRDSTQSMSSMQSDVACLGKPPTFEEIQKKQSYSPAIAREELFMTLLNHSHEDISEGVVQGKRVLRVSFKKVQSEGVPDLSRQDLIFNALVFMLNHEPKKYVSLTLQHCAILDGAKLDSFLHPQLEVLDLRFCPLITEREVQTISQKCPNLQELYLSGTKVRWIAQTGIITNGPLDLPQLTHLQVEKAPGLQEIRLKAPRLKKLIANDNPSLQTVDVLNLETFPYLEFKNCQNLGLDNPFKKLNPLSIFNQLLTKVKKDPYILPYPPYVLPHPLPFLLIETLGEALSQEILSLGYEEAAKKYIEPLFELIELSKKDPLMATTAANAITILNFAGIPLAGKNFQGIHIPGANLGRACLQKADLRGADLKCVRLSEAELNHCQLAGANMHHVEMRPEVIWCENSVNCLIVDGTGKRWIAAVGNDISIVDMETGKEVKKLAGHTNSVKTLAELEGGKKLASGSYDNTIRVWEVETGREMKKLEGHTGCVYALTVLEGRKKLASGSEDKTIRVWDVETGREMKKLEGHTNSVTTLAMLEEGKKLLSGSVDNTIRVWDVETGSEVKKLVGYTTGSVMTLAVLEGGKKLASGSSDKTIRVWDVETGSEVKKLVGYTTGSVMTLAVLEGGKKLASGSSDGTIRVWDVETGKELKKLTGHADRVTTLAELEGGKKLASGSWDKTIRVWGVEMGSEVKKLAGHTSWVTTLAVLEGGKKLASGSDDKTIRVWGVETGREVKKLAGHTGSVMTLVLLEGGKKLVSGSVDNTIRVWEMETGREVKKLEGHTDSVSTLALLEGGKKLVSGSYDKTIRVWGVETGREVKKLEGHTDWVRTLAVLEGGKKLASGSYDNTILVWEVETGREVKKLAGHTDGVTILALLEGGKKLASGSADKTIRIWEVETGREVKKLAGHTGSVTTLALLEGGKKLASGSADKTIRIWEVESGRELFAISTFPSIQSLKFKEPDLLYAGDASGGLWCWRLDFKTPEQPFTLLWTHRPTLSCQGVEIKDIQNLSELNQRLMLDHGAKLVRPCSD